MTSRWIATSRTTSPVAIPSWSWNWPARWRQPSTRPGANTEPFGQPSQWTRIPEIPFTGDGDQFRPLNDDPFLIDFSVDGRDLVDSDMDGLLDAIEDLNENGLADATETNSDNPDSDGDSNLDGDEIRTGTNPLDAASFFSVCIEASTASTFQLSWPSASGATYRVEGSSDMAFGDTVLDNFPASTSGDSTAIEIEMPEGEVRYFFRVRLLP